MASAEAGSYPKPVVDNFMKSCTAQANATKSYCECTIEELQKTLPYDDFKAADAAIQKGGEGPREGADRDRGGHQEVPQVARAAS